MSNLLPWRNFIDFLTVVYYLFLLFLCCDYVNKCVVMPELDVFRKRDNKQKTTTKVHRRIEEGNSAASSQQTTTGKNTFDQFFYLFNCIPITWLNCRGISLNE